MLRPAVIFAAFAAFAAAVPSQAAGHNVLIVIADDLGGVTLVPGTGGIFEIRCAGSLLWERTRDGGFPEAKVLKQRLRDLIDPGRDLGHADRPLP